MNNFGEAIAFIIEIEKRLLALQEIPENKRTKYECLRSKNKIFNQCTDRN